MEAIVFAFVAYILIQTVFGSKTSRLLSSLRSKPQPSKANIRRAANRADSERPDVSPASELLKLRARVKTMSEPHGDPWSDEKSRLQARLKQAQATEFGTAAATRTKAERLPDLFNQNRARRSDWGQRARPEIFSVRNLLLGILGMLILYVITQMPTHLIF